MDWYIKVLKQYAVFEGRARRTEYWMFTLINFIVLIALGFVEGLIGLAGVLSFIYMLGVLLPSLGVAIRRLHDTDRSGWWLLLIFLPIIGPIVLLVFFVLDSTPGSNDYGDNPKDSAADSPVEAA